MKTIFDQTTRDEIIDRIKVLEENLAPLWGKMNAYQMIRHCSLFDEWVLGRNDPVYKQGSLGRLFGKRVLKGMLKDDGPLKRNMPTTSDLKIKERTGDIELERTKWISSIESYANYSNPNFIHDFFGEMTVEQIGYFVYKHTDHHLRQFSA